MLTWERELSRTTSLGTLFDIRQFNHVLLDEGVVPLRELRAHVEAWIAEQSAVSPAR